MKVSMKALLSKALRRLYQGSINAEEAMFARYASSLFKGIFRN
jgi:hypothetical protein